MAVLDRTSGWQQAFGFIEPYARQAVAGGLSFRSFYETMKDAGFSYRRSRMLTDWRQVGDLYIHEAEITALPSESVVPERYATVSDKKQRANYLALVEYEYYDPITDKMVTSHRMIGSQSLMKKGTYEHTAATAFSPGRPYADPSATNFNLRVVLRKS